MITPVAYINNMVVYECRPGNMPEDLNENLDKPFVIGDTLDEVSKEYTKVDCHRFCIRKNHTWCGEHPRFWRPMTLNERIVYIKNYITYTNGEIKAIKKMNK